MTSPELNRLLPSPNEMSGTKRRYMEQYGYAIVTNRYLRIAVLCLSAVAIGLLILNLKTLNSYRNFKPLVIRINEIGRAEAVTYDSLTYQPRDAEIKYFLIQFVTKYYGRMRATVRENYARSLYFLDGRLADATIESNKKNKTIETFMTGQSEEIEIHVTNVAIEDLRQAPYKATVDFEKAYFPPNDHVETKRERYVANFIFTLKERVPNAWIPENPLGVTITYFREDQAFQ
jgi:type IV secretory pathway TrbF-like protein